MRFPFLSNATNHADAKITELETQPHEKNTRKSKIKIETSTTEITANYHHIILLMDMWHSLQRFWPTRRVMGGAVGGAILSASHEAGSYLFISISKLYLSLPLPLFPPPLFHLLLFFLSLPLPDLDLHLGYVCSYVRM